MDLLTPLAATVLTPLDQYHRLVESGALRADDHQTRIIKRLQRLHDELATYDPPQLPNSSPSFSLVRGNIAHTIAFYVYLA